MDLDPPSQPGEPLPTHLGQYVVVRELGRGGMGVVYLARDPKLDRLVAIKVLPETLERDKDRLGRFEREARVLASLNHTNIASIFSVDQTPTGARLLVLEYVEGQNLADLLTRGPMTVKEALRLCLQIGRAIAAAHSKGIIHRDIKPGNVMVTADGHVKVLDFGLSTRETERSSAFGNASTTDFQTASLATMPGRVMGTAGYMSPEQARGKPVDKRTDIWAFGCIMYKCLSGSHVFAGETTTDVIVATLSTDPDWERLPPTTPERVRKLLASCLEKSPDDRLNDIAIAVEEVEKAIAEHEKGGGLVHARFGDYQVIQELHRGPSAALCLVRSARSEDAEPTVAKIIEPSSMILGSEQASAKCREFLQGVGVQKKAAAQDPRTWAPVYASGRASTAAYWVTDRYQRSAADLFQSRQRLDAAELRNIILSAACAVRAINAACKRAHGNIKPSNVLIGEGDDLATAAIALTDPLPESQLAAVTAAPNDPGDRRDLRDLGRLIHTLVLHREWNGKELPADSAEWKRLGRHGKTWRELCCKLLGPEATPIALDELIRTVDRLKSVRLPKRNMVIAAAAVLGFVLLGVVITLLLNRPAPVLVAPAPTPTPEPAPVVAPAPVVVERPWWVAVLCSPEAGARLSAVLPGAPAAATSNDPAAIAKCEKEVHEFVEAHLKSISDRGRALVEMGLTGIERKIRTRMSLPETGLRTAPQGDVDAVGIVISALQQTHQLDVELAKIQQDMDSLRQSAAELLATAKDIAPSSTPEQDQFLAGFIHIALRIINEQDDLAGIEYQIDFSKRAAENVLQIVKAHWKDIDHAWMRQQSPLYQHHQVMEGDSFASIYGEWEEELPKDEYKLLPPEQDPTRAVVVIADRLQSAMQAYSAECDRALSSMRAMEFEDLQRRVAAFQDRGWDRTREGKREIELAMTTLDQRSQRYIESLDNARRSCTGDCEAMLADLLTRELHGLADSAVVQQVWEQGKAAIAAEEEDCRARFDLVSDLRNFLQECIATYAPVKVPTRWQADAVRSNTIRTFSRTKHEALLASLLRDMTTGGLADDTMRDERNRVEQEFAAWREAAERVLADMADAEDRLNDCYGLHEALPGQESIHQIHSRWRAEAALDEVRPIVNDIVQRIEAMEAMPSDRAGLVAIVMNASDRGERRLSAWRSLATVEPMHVDALEQELHATAAIREQVLSGVNTNRAHAISRELDQQLINRWREHAYTGPDGLARAAHVQDRYGIQEGDLEAPLQFSLRLFRFRESVRALEDDEDKLREATGEFRTWLSLRESNLTDAARVLLTKLEVLLSDEEPGTDWTQIGPGRLGWQADPRDDGELIVFTPPATAAWNLSMPLVFRRVGSAADGAEDMYLCTTELPVGVFIDALNEATRRGELAWSDIRNLMRGTENRQGYVVWRWNAAQTMELATQWTEVAQQYAPQIVIEPPGARHPMQYVSAAASRRFAELFGCSLPSLSDWMDAYNQNSAEARSSANLRDAAWQTQDQFRHDGGDLNRATRLAHTVSVFQTQGLEGNPNAIWTRAMLGLGGGDFDDGSLFFRPVAPSTGMETEFRDLIGNVAEFVLSDLPAGADPASARIMVIGASALSNPAMHSLDRTPIEIANFLADGTSLRPRETAEQREQRVALLTYSDVGVRLALRAGAVQASFLARLKDALRNVDYTLVRND